MLKAAQEVELLVTEAKQLKEEDLVVLVVVPGLILKNGLKLKYDG